MTGNFTTMEPTFSASGPHTLAVRGLNGCTACGARSTTASGQRSRARADRQRDREELRRRRRSEVEVERPGRAAHPAAHRDRRQREARGAADRFRRRRRTNTTSTSCGDARASAATSSRSGSTSGTDKEYLYFGPSTTKAPTPYRLGWGSGPGRPEGHAHDGKPGQEGDGPRLGPRAAEADRGKRRLERPEAASGSTRSSPRSCASAIRARSASSRGRCSRATRRKRAARDILLGHAHELVKAQGHRRRPAAPARRLARPARRHRHADSRVNTSSPRPRTRSTATATRRNSPRAARTPTQASRPEARDEPGRAQRRHRHRQGHRGEGPRQARTHPGDLSVARRDPRRAGCSVAAPMAGNDRGFFFMPKVERRSDPRLSTWACGITRSSSASCGTRVQKPPSPDERQRMIRSKNEPHDPLRRLHARRRQHGRASSSRTGTATRS